MNDDLLKLGNQLCFPVYAASRLIIREYQPYLDEIGLTYPQYLTMMVLWERDGLSVNEIAGKLILNTNTITPLLKRLEQQGWIRRERSEQDVRKVIIHLTAEGRGLKEKALAIPEALSEKILAGPFDLDDLSKLKKELDRLVEYLAHSSPQ